MLYKRILSAIILAPISILAVWIGSWVFVIFIGLIGSLLSWEWTKICRGYFGISGALISFMTILISILGYKDPVSTAIVITITMLIIPIVDRKKVLWMIFGVLYIGLPCWSLVWLRGHECNTFFLLMFLVWATDIGAYIVGSLTGGPKLLFIISPKKTWAGLFGGLLSASIVGVLMGLEAGGSLFTLAVLSSCLAIVAQIGDLSESCIKRHFGVKDSSNIIPGHGGAFDRLDGLLATAPVMVLLCLMIGDGFPFYE
ncbi:MAG: phosphatidate cytidylyltransferase [Rhodospirillaceae bacterium]|jgi:phosphatidate cytidylyltransferase|nr:phosphatidate cytidylyltransferase [Rhodospirillaceae bacterium]